MTLHYKSIITCNISGDDLSNGGTVEVINHFLMTVYEYIQPFKQTKTQIDSIIIETRLNILMHSYI